MARTCDRCNAQMNVGRPRVRVNKQMWCQTCAKDTNSPSGKYKPGTDIKVAHFNEDGEYSEPLRREDRRYDPEIHHMEDPREFSTEKRMVKADPNMCQACGSDEKYIKGLCKNCWAHQGGSSYESQPTHMHDPTDEGAHDKLRKILNPHVDQHGRGFAELTPHNTPVRRSLNSLEPSMAIKIALREHKTGQRLFVLAHDSGDGETIYHCPFCGSGQVLARSDRTIECEFCHTSFTVQVQPEYSAFPQTMDGMPVQVPGMPGQIDQPVGGGPQDPSMAQDPMAAEDTDGDGIPDQGGFDDGAPASASNQPPWLTAGLKTTTGARLPIEEFVHHLAIKHAGSQRTAVLRRVKASREFT